MIDNHGSRPNGWEPLHECAPGRAASLQTWSTGFDFSHSCFCRRGRTVKASQKLGLEEVPVHVAENLVPEQIRAYRIADNKSVELATWAYDLLAIELADLQAAEFDIELLGFSEKELAQLLESDVKSGLKVADTSSYAHPLIAGNRILVKDQDALTMWTIE